MGILKLLNPWVYLALLVMLAASGAYGYYEGRADGRAVEKSEWATRENAELTKANAKILELTNQARGDESLHAVKLASISNKYQEDLKNETVKKDALIADLRAGKRSLHVPVTNSSKACGGEASGTGSGAWRSHGQETAELYQPFSEDVIRLLNEADDTAIQVTHLQEVASEDRRLCGQIKPR